MRGSRAVTRNLDEALNLAADDPQRQPKGKLAKFSYYIPDEVKKQVLAAADSSKVPAGERNKLYRALNRALNTYKEYIDPKVLARWAAAGDDAEQKFSFLKEWVKDPQFGQIKIRESEQQIDSAYKGTDWTWVTKGDLYTRFSGWTSKEGAAWAEKIMKGAGKPRPHPEKAHRKDPEMKIYKVLASVMEGARKENKKVSELNVSTNVFGISDIRL